MYSSWLKRCDRPLQLLTEASGGVVKTATFEALLSDVVPDGQGGYLFTLEGKAYHLQDKDDVRKIAEEHGYIIIY